MREVLIRSSESVLCLAEVAENPWTRCWGLLGRKGLPENRGLLIRPCKSVHTFFMRFPIDVVYLTTDNTVAKTCSRLHPFRFSAGGRQAHSVLELPAGLLNRIGIVVGEKLVIALAAKEGADNSGRG